MYWVPLNLTREHSFTHWKLVGAKFKTSNMKWGYKWRNHFRSVDWAILGDSNHWSLCRDAHRPLYFTQTITPVGRCQDRHNSCYTFNGRRRLFKLFNNNSIAAPSSIQCKRDYTEHEEGLCVHCSDYSVHSGLSLVLTIHRWRRTGPNL